MKTSFKIWLTLDRQIYRRFHDIIIPSSNGTTQIDHLLVSVYGLFIIETKNKKGWIFGSEHQAQWTQVVRGRKYYFQNPLRQVYRQQKVLSEFLGLDESKIHTLVCFVSTSKFKTTMPPNVIDRRLGRFVKGHTAKLLEPEEVERILHKLNDHLSTSTLTTADHVRSLEARHSSQTLCPSCGSKLLPRTVQKGAKAGNKFLGCETYPKCKYTKDL